MNKLIGGFYKVANYYTKITKRTEHQLMIKRTEKQAKKSKRLQVARQVIGGGMIMFILLSGKVVSAAPITEYKIAPGDTWYKISQIVGVPVNQLQEMNGTKSDVLRLNETIYIPTTKPVTPNTTPKEETTFTNYKVKSGDSWYVLSTQTGVSIDNLKKMNNRTSDVLRINETIKLPTTKKVETATVADKKTDVVIDIVRVVSKNDTLFRISEEYRTTVKKIQVDNGLKNTTLKTGQKLLITGITQDSKAVFDGIVDSNSVQFQLSSGKKVILKTTPFFPTDEFSNMVKGKTKLSINFNATKKELISHKIR